jgi:hypothetical protein
LTKKYPDASQLEDILEFCVNACIAVLDSL